MSESKVPEYLLSKNQEASAENVALFHSAERGDLAEVRRLLAAGAKPNFFHRPEDQKNALHVAAENANEAVVQCLLEHGAAANSIAAADQSNALNLAARNPRAKPQIIEMLVDHGADPSHSNGYGNTPLHEAALSGNLAVAEALLGRGVVANLQNHRGSTPLHSLCYSQLGDSAALEQLGELLLVSGVDVDARDKHQMTPLLVAVAHNHAALLQWLLSKGASLRATDDCGRDAAEIARFHEHAELAEELAKRMHSHK